MKKKFCMTFLALLIFSLSTILYGCKGGKDNGKNETTPTDNISSEPANGGSIVVGISQDLDSLDPHKAVAAGTEEVLFNIYEGLVKPDKDGNLVPAVAENYNVKEGGKVYSFTLREGIRFHNGNAVTVEDIEYSIKRCAGLLEETDSSVIVETALSNVLEVKIIDEKTVDIILKEADTEFIGYLTAAAAIVPKDYKDIEMKPVGTGPFKFVSYSPLENFVVEKNLNYWDDTMPYLDKVTFKILSNADSALMELKGGNIDIYPYIADAQAEQITGDFNIEEGNMNLVQALFLNNAKAPFDNIKVRQALNYAVNKQEILDMVAGGKGRTIGTNMFPAFAKYYDTELDNYYSVDYEKAKNLLSEAGYPNGFEFTITVPSNYQFHVDTAQVIIEQLKNIGVTAKIKSVEWTTWLNDVYKERDYQATIIGLDSKLAARDALDRFDSDGEYNFINYSNTAYDSDLEKAIKTTDEEEKIKYYKNLQRYLTEDGAAVYIQDPPLLVAVNKKLAGYTFYPVYVQDMSSVYFIK